MKYRLFGLSFVLVLILSAWTTVSAQEPTGGGSLVRDIMGGAALIFRPPNNPVVQEPQPSGGRTGGRRPAPVRKQDQMIARANAARSAPKPRYTEAEQQYQMAAEVAPDDARAFAGLGNIYVDQGRFAEAVDAYRKAIAVRPEYTPAYMPLAFSLARLDRYPEAIEIYQQTLKQDSSNPEIYNNLSFAYNHSQKYQEAIDAAKEAIRLLGDTGQAYTQGFQDRKEILSYAYKNLGNGYAGLKRYGEAADALKQAAKIVPTNASAQFNLGLSLYHAGRYSEAIEAYKEVLKLRPSLAQAHFNLGVTYYAINDKTSAMAEVDALKAIDSEMANQLLAIVQQR